mmetsp:Transcript_34700/g.98324  ORF Transcript_34700/g.98324 Transcript_34700/m.98324 type:complete len:209 (-) Transcript_34700:331-957(-)
MTAPECPRVPLGCWREPPPPKLSPSPAQSRRRITAPLPSAAASRTALQVGGPGSPPCCSPCPTASPSQSATSRGTLPPPPTPLPADLVGASCPTRWFAAAATTEVRCARKLCQGGCASDPSPAASRSRPSLAKRAAAWPGAVTAPPTNLSLPMLETREVSSSSSSLFASSGRDSTASLSRRNSTPCSGCRASAKLETPAGVRMSEPLA